MFNLKTIMASISKAIPISTLTTITHTNLIIPYYHMVSDETVIHIKHLYPHKSTKQFISDIEFLTEEFNPITLRELLTYSKNGQKVPPRALLLTFDDGFREMEGVVAPILLRKGIPATFFVNSSFVDNLHFCYQHKASVLVEDIQQKNIPATARKRIEELLLQHHIKAGNITAGILAINYQQRGLVDQIAAFLEIDMDAYLLQNAPYLTTDQIVRLLKDGFTIGAHSIDHPLYANLTLDEQLHQTTESIKYIKGNFRLDYGAFAFPHSDSGVTNRYFKEVNRTGMVDLSFGTAGIISDCVPNNFQRFSLEKPSIPAQKIIALQLAKNIYRFVKRSNRIIRT